MELFPPLWKREPTALSDTGTMQGLSTANPPCRAESISQHHSKGSLGREKRWLFSQLPVTFPSENRGPLPSLLDTISILPTSNPERKRTKMLDTKTGT